MLERIIDLNILLYTMAVLGSLGIAGMFATHLTYRRVMKSTNAENMGIKEKWLTLWKTRDKLLGRMNRMVWYPSLLCTALLGTAVYLTTRMEQRKGLPLIYLYLGAAVPILLLFLRLALDFTYKEELMLESLVDYVEHARVYVEENDVKKLNPVLREDVVDQIAESIRQTAAAGSHFSRMLEPEEEEILREIIREFMD